MIWILFIPSKALDFLPAYFKHFIKNKIDYGKFNQ